MTEIILKNNWLREVTDNNQTLKLLENLIYIDLSGSWFNTIDINMFKRAPKLQKLLLIENHFSAPLDTTGLHFVVDVRRIQHYRD